MRLENDICKEVLYSKEQIETKALELASLINKDYENKDVVLVCTLKGAVPFFSALIKGIQIDCSLEFIKASSYVGNTTITIGNVKLSSTLDFDVLQKDVLIIEDIVDTGLTCSSLIAHFKEKGCKSCEVCCMLDKPSRRKVELKPKYKGFEIPDAFVVGYGLDYNQKYRTLPYVGIINDKYI